MSPLLLMRMLEGADPAFKNWFYPRELRCPIDSRVVYAIENHQPVYLPTRTEYRDWKKRRKRNNGRYARMTIIIKGEEPLYQPDPETLKKLNAWKLKVRGTLAELRVHKSDTTWKRFFEILENDQGIKALLTILDPLRKWLIHEEAMWPKARPANHAEVFFKEDYNILLSQGSPYRFTASQRQEALRSEKPDIDKLVLINLIRDILDGPLMALAMLDGCMVGSPFAHSWIGLGELIERTLVNLRPGCFKRYWLEAAMIKARAVKKNGDIYPAKWARGFLASSDSKWDQEKKAREKAIEVNSWLRWNKPVRPSLKNIERMFGLIPDSRMNSQVWRFSWMTVLCLDRHFDEIWEHFKGDADKVKEYYGAYFHHFQRAKKVVAKLRRDGTDAAG